MSVTEAIFELVELSQCRILCNGGPSSEDKSLKVVLDELKRLTSLLEECLPYVLSQNEAEGMMDGFGPRRDRPSDDLLKRLKKAVGRE